RLRAYWSPRRTAPPTPVRSGSRIQHTPSWGRTRVVASSDASSTTSTSVAGKTPHTSRTTIGRLAASLHAGSSTSGFRIPSASPCCGGGGGGRRGRAAPHQGGERRHRREVAQEVGEREEQARRVAEAPCGAQPGGGALKAEREAEGEGEGEGRRRARAECRRGRGRGRERHRE